MTDTFQIFTALTNIDAALYAARLERDTNADRVPSAKTSRWVETSARHLRNLVQARIERLAGVAVGGGPHAEPGTPHRIGPARELCASTNGGPSLNRDNASITDIERRHQG